MHCIPVLDLLAGVVVRAVRGDRAAYRPLVSPLVESSLPLAVAAAFYTQFGSRRFYIADLDAIQNQGSNAPVVHTLAAAYPACQWWVDAGITSVEAFAHYASAPNIRWVLGSESLPSFAAYADLARCERRFILSLDSRAGQPLGPAELWTAPTLWPAEVIAMTLPRRRQRRPGLLAAGAIKTALAAHRAGGRRGHAPSGRFAGLEKPGGASRAVGERPA